MKKIYILLPVLFLLFACYDDKGNYNYADIDEIQVEFPGSTQKADQIIYSGKVFDSLVICPDIQYGKPGNLAYSWEIYATATGVTLDTLSRKKDLRILLSTNDSTTFIWNTGKYLVKFRAADTISRQERHVLLNIVVRSPHPTGIYLLHGNKTESDIATLENDDFTDGMTQSIFQPTYYSSQLGKKLQGEGRSISWFRDFEQGFGVFVFTDKDGKYINLTSFTEEFGIERMFGGSVPEGISIRQFVTYPPQGISILYCENAKVYQSYYPLDTKFETLPGIDEYTGKEPGYFDADAGLPTSDLGDLYLAYAKDRNSFFSYDFWSANLVAPCPDDPNNPAWNPKQMQEQTLIGIDYGKPNGWYLYNQMQYILFRNEQGNITAYRINPGNPTEGYALYDKTFTIATNETNSELINLNCFSMSQLSEGLGYFSTPDAVYAFDFINSAEPTELFRPANANEKITRIKLLKSNNLESMEDMNDAFLSRLCLSLYAATWDGTQGRLYRIPVTAEGEIDTNREMEVFEGMGEIHDLTFRLQ